MSYQALSHIPYQTLKDIVFDIVNGDKIKDIAEKYKISKNTVRTLTKENLEDRLSDYNTQIFKLSAARENDRINSIKDEMYKYINDVYKEVNNPKKKIDIKTRMYYMNSCTSMLVALNNIARLNNNEATDINENRNKNINYDVAELMKKLKTPEQQKAFLLEELNNINK